jgi:hypothetical protein
MSESEDFVNVTWHTTLEEYFAATGERAQCLAWCHKRAEEMYAHRRTFIDLPVIVLSGVTGFCSVGSQNIFGPENGQLSSIVLGASSLLVSILNTVGSYFAWAKRAEGHRISSIQYSRLYRMLMVEMNLPRQERRTPAALLKDVKDQYDRLQEISPLLPPEIVNVFRKRFDHQTDISKPEETNGLENISIYPMDAKITPTPSQHIPAHVQNVVGFQSPALRPTLETARTEDNVETV